MMFYYNTLSYLYLEIIDFFYFSKEADISLTDWVGYFASLLLMISF
jgi:hypothetical protein